MSYKEKVRQGIKCCIQQKKKCRECPFYNNGNYQCDELREEVLHTFITESYHFEDWSGLQGGL